MQEIWREIKKEINSPNPRKQNEDNKNIKK